LSDLVLWTRLTPTAFNSMHGAAAHSQRGGGARHIPLGVSSKRFPIEAFLRVSGRSKIEILAESQTAGPGELKFSSIRSRRAGEWMVTDQRSHRHPAWSPAAGFPTVFDSSNPPIIMLFRTGGQFQARFTSSRKFAALEPDASKSSKGILLASEKLLSAFDVAPGALINSFDEYVRAAPFEPFDPTTLEDGRKKLFASIVRRQGQGAFRTSLLDAYGGRCAITRTRTEWVLEAAHIVPYRGTKTNVLQNGLVLRADIHTLFDLGLISVHPGERRVKVSRVLANSAYNTLHEKPLLQPGVLANRPSEQALSFHFSRFRR
jgi:HNH endonuclease